MSNTDEEMVLMKAVAELWDHKAVLARYKGMDKQKMDEEILTIIMESIKKQTKNLEQSHKKVLRLSVKLLNKKPPISKNDFEILENASRALNPNADSDDGGLLPSLKPFESESKNMEFSVTVTKGGKAF